jgi:uroporphyrin-III C-methyltransferase
MSAKVYLVGAGPGDPELLTIKALKLLKSADVVLHDALISPEVLALIPRTTQLRSVGKRCGQKSTPQAEINRLIISYAKLDLQVVRLKGGDPLVFGRSGEEIEALRQANIDFEIVPGITAALGAASAAKIPLTHRDVSSAVIFLTSHHSESATDDRWPAKLPGNATLVIYMPGRNYPQTTERLRRAGMSSQTPCAIISRAASAGEQVFKTTVGELASAPEAPAPSLLVVGEVARLAEHASLNPPSWLGAQTDPELQSLFASDGFLTPSAGTSSARFASSSDSYSSAYLSSREQPE